MSIIKTTPRILICAPSSGCGKTLITCGILRILQRHGFKPSSFKCGPDYIDPLFHKKVIGIPSRNLDVFLAGKDGVISTLMKGMRDVDIAVIEGVMGFYDGISATSMEGSSYDISVITKTPAMIVIDCKGMSKSIIPMIKGFLEYADKKQIKGVFLNNISDMLALKIKDEILKETGIPVMGHLPRLKEASFESRHLGLVMPDEVEDILEKLDAFSYEIEKRFDMELFMNIAEHAGNVKKDNDTKSEKTGSNSNSPDSIKAENKVKVGVALDEAFCFYYEDNLDMLKDMGAEIVFFSPIHDKKLPDVSRILIGGGYPELYADKLSKNESMRNSIKEAVNGGMPVLSECGGFLYLLEKIKDADGNEYPMAGVFKGESFMTGKLSHFGYVNVSAARDNPYLFKGEDIKGHEFHYYDTTGNGDILRMDKPAGNRSWEGYALNNNAFGGFAHLYYPSCPEFAKRFLER